MARKYYSTPEANNEKFISTHKKNEVIKLFADVKGFITWNKRGEGAKE